MTHSISVRPTPVRRVAAVLAALLALPLVGPRAQAAHARPRHGVTHVYLRFRPGRRRLVERGFVGSPEHWKDYAFSARAGQRLDIDLIGIPPPGAGRFGGVVPTYMITFPDGKTYQPKGDPFDGRLTETGTYRITVGINSMATNARQGRYRMILTRSR